MGWPRNAVMTCVLLLIASTAMAADTKASKGPKLKELKWLTSYDGALSLARQQDKLVMAYFHGSDWDPWCEKLEKEVMNTELFHNWAAQNVILLDVDFPHEKVLPGSVKSQNARLRGKYSVGKTPTFVFLDNVGQPIARAGYDDARLRDDEPKGEPRAWIAYLENIVKNRPKDEEIVRQPNLTEALAYAKKHYLPALVMLTQGHTAPAIQQRDELLKNQLFVKFVNRSAVYAQVDWPEESDTSEDAKAIRAFIERHKITPNPVQLVVWEPPDKVQARLAAFRPEHAERLVNQIQAMLPKFDYNGSWIDDYRKALAIAAQTKRFIFLSFTSMDTGDWSKKIDGEIYQTSEFKAYAHKQLVPVKLDFPSTTTQPAALVTQNKMLAETFNVRGFPTVIVLNPLGQKVAEAKYRKGGPVPFLAELDSAIRADADRRADLEKDKKEDESR